MGFFNKIDNSTIIVDTLEQIWKKRHCEVFLRMSWRLVHSINICFTVSGIPQESRSSKRLHVCVGVSG